MGNKKGRLRRNKKPNNWRAMREKKKFQHDLSDIHFDGGNVSLMCRWIG